MQAAGLLQHREIGKCHLQQCSAKEWNEASMNERMSVLLHILD